MKKRTILCGIVSWMIPAVLLGMFFTACGGNENREEVEGMPPAPRQQEMIPMDGDGAPEPEVGAAAPGLDADDYEIVLDVDQRIVLHHKGHLKVWIGLEKNVPELLEGKARDSVGVPAEEMKAYARITIFAPEFTVEPALTQVTTVSPSGSSVAFAVTPEQEGHSEINATVELFDNDDFQGLAASRTETVKVTVFVDRWAVMKDRLRQLTDVTWDKFIVFWGAFVAILFGLALYLIRKFLKKKTGYDDKSSGGE